MKQLTDNEIFDLLDGIASEEVCQRHQQLIDIDENYRLYFTELRQLHEDMIFMPLESPSLAFENKLINRWEAAQSSYKIPIIGQRLPFIFGGLMFGLVLITAFLFLRQQPATIEVNSLENLLLGINSETIQEILILINGLLLLLVFEQILKKYWGQRVRKA